MTYKEDSRMRFEFETDETVVQQLLEVADYELPELIAAVVAAVEERHYTADAAGVQEDMRQVVADLRKAVGL
jgi:hypothetical protein